MIRSRCYKWYIRTHDLHKYDIIILKIASDTDRAEGLAAMLETGTVQVPELLGIGKDPEGFSFLLMEYIEAERASGKCWGELGRSLACMHKAPVTGKASFGWQRDNYIGARRQINAGHDSWISFFRDCRLAPQFGASYLSSVQQILKRYAG